MYVRLRFAWQRILCRVDYVVQNLICIRKPIFQWRSENNTMHRIITSSIHVNRNNMLCHRFFWPVRLMQWIFNQLSPSFPSGFPIAKCIMPRVTSSPIQATPSVIETIVCTAFKRKKDTIHTHMIEIWRNRITASTKIKVDWEPYVLVSVLKVRFERFI